MLLPRRNVVMCLCGHSLPTHLIGICPVPTCACVREPPSTDDRRDSLPCDRCGAMTPVLYLLRSEILEMMVCQGCVEIAVDLGIVTAESRQSRDFSNA